MNGEFARIIFDRYRVVTVCVKYYMPDHPNILAPDFIWQKYDLVPDLPAVRKFLEFWQAEIEARIHSVTVGHQSLVEPQKYRYFDYQLDDMRPN